MDKVLAYKHTESWTKCLKIMDLRKFNRLFCIQERLYSCRKVQAERTDEYVREEEGCRINWVEMRTFIIASHTQPFSLILWEVLAVPATPGRVWDAWSGQFEALWYQRKIQGP